MFCLNIALGNVSWRLLYQKEDTAKHQLGILHDTKHLHEVRLEDDFGQSLTVLKGSLHGFMLEDLDQTKMAHVEMALHQERTKVLATKLAQTDPALRADAAARSPAILNPMGNGRMPF